MHGERSDVPPAPSPTLVRIDAALRAADTETLPQKRRRLDANGGVRLLPGDEPPVTLRHKERKSRTEMRAYRVRMRPTGPQRDELRRWFDCARWAYNAAVDRLNDGTLAWTMQRRAQNVFLGSRKQGTCRIPPRFDDVHGL